MKKSQSIGYLGISGGGDAKSSSTSVRPMMPSQMANHPVQPLFRRHDGHVRLLFRNAHDVGKPMVGFAPRHELLFPEPVEGYVGSCLQFRQAAPIG